MLGTRFDANKAGARVYQRRFLGARVLTRFKNNFASPGNAYGVELIYVRIDSNQLRFRNASLAKTCIYIKKKTRLNSYLSTL